MDTTVRPILELQNVSKRYGGGIPLNNFDFLLPAGGGHGLVGEKGLLESIKKRQEFAALEQSIQRARAENARLREEAKRLRSDPATIEDLARRELGLIKPGEHLFTLKDRPSGEGR